MRGRVEPDHGPETKNSHPTGRKSELAGRKPAADAGGASGARILGVKVLGRDESECNHFQPGDRNIS